MFHDFQYMKKVHVMRGENNRHGLKQCGVDRSLAVNPDQERAFIA